MVEKWKPLPPTVTPLNVIGVFAPYRVENGIVKQTKVSTAWAKVLHFPGVTLKELFNDLP